MKYQFIEHHKREFPIVLMCNVLGVSESGFYAWRKRPTCQRQREDARLTEEIRQVFVGHQGRYGSPRIHRELQDQGRSTSRKRTSSLEERVQYRRQSLSSLISSSLTITSLIWVHKLTHRLHSLKELESIPIILLNSPVPSWGEHQHYHAIFLGMSFGLAELYTTVNKSLGRTR